MNSDAKSSWWPGTGGVAQGLILEEVVFNVFINKLDDGMASILNVFVDGWCIKLNWVEQKTNIF